MGNKIMVWVIVILASCIVIDLIFQAFHLPPIVHKVTLIFVLFMMVNNSSLKGKSYYKIFIAAIVILCLGFLFKILHLTGGDQLLLAGYGSTLTIYLFHFASKSKKRLLDVLKVLALSFYIITSVSTILHIINVEYRWHLNLIALGLVLITFIAFIMDGADTLFKNNS